tara:strand:+ start:1683 stop:2939 length:1257 start_codon:yes stop_codon:yes gene_type:complete
MAGAFNNAWNFLKATPEQQLMGMRGSIPQALSRFPRRDVSRAPFTGESMNMDREFGEDAGKEQMAEVARLRAEGMTGSEKDRMTSEGARGPADLQQYYDNQFEEGFIAPQEKRMMLRPGETETERAARLNLGGGQRGARMDATSMTGAQRFGSIDEETGESRGRPQIRVKRGNMEGMMTMGRGRGRRGALNPRTAEALPEESQSQSKPITDGQNYIKLLESMQEKNPNMQINIPTEAELAGGAKEKRPYKSMIDNDELEGIEDELTNIHGPEMASRIVQSMIDNPQPPALRTAGVRQQNTDPQGDRPAYRPSTGQFLGPQFDDKGEPKMTSRGQPSMTGISPMDIEQMGRDAMVDGEIDPRITGRYTDALDKVPVTAGEKTRTTRAAEQAMQEYAQRTGQGLNYTQSTDAEGNVRYGL